MQAPKQISSQKNLVEESYHKRIDENVDQLAEAFADIIRVSGIENKDRFKISQEAYQVECRAASIVNSVESLLSLIAELKQSFLLNDTHTWVNSAQKRVEALSAKKSHIKSRLSSIRDELEMAIADMENAYYFVPEQYTVPGEHS
ncbi:uncharacterized protein VTP21DRAFT_844 [Calcarisporiella thermophila]|uniref:uncharacterized protein n=1 Tax=Calcarisporiella thermophila TaxID=911321 RepID=UPI003743CF84